MKDGEFLRDTWEQCLRLRKRTVDELKEMFGWRVGTVRGGPHRNFVYGKNQWRSGGYDSKDYKYVSKVYQKLKKHLRYVTLRP